MKEIEGIKKISARKIHNNLFRLPFSMKSSRITISSFGEPADCHSLRANSKIILIEKAVKEDIKMHEANHINFTRNGKSSIKRAEVKRLMDIATKIPAIKE